jgi:hypothetical protein
MHAVMRGRIEDPFERPVHPRRPAFGRIQSRVDKRPAAIEDAPFA